MARYNLKRFGFDNATLLKEKPSDLVNRISKEFGLYVLDSRSIPALEDGLKNVQRIALWMMRSRQGKIKTMALSGEMIKEELYVHGEKSAQDAIGLLAAPFRNNVTLLKGEGTFGSRKKPRGIGAPRYTYVRRSPFSREVLFKDMEILDMVDNHDGSNTMPRCFYPLLPLVLLNGISGQAIGWATNILPHSLNDLIQAVEDVLKTGKVQNKLMPKWDKYDVDIEELENPNQYAISGKVEIINTTTVSVVCIPPNISVEKYRERLIVLEEKGLINSWEDNSARNIDITVKMSRVQLRDNQDDLATYLKLRTTMTENIVVQGIGGKTVISYDSAEKLVKDWVNWRVGLYEQRYEYLLGKALDDILYWKCLLVCHEASIYRNEAAMSSKSSLKSEMYAVIENAGLEIRENILERIAQIPIYKWTDEGYQDAQDALQNREKNAKEYRIIFESKTKRKNIFRKEVEALKNV
jgi:DNA topoisomerase-2